MEPERATQIQTALIKAGYMTGTPTGVWDAQSQAAMEKLQADNGWQTKLVPDSRAIIKLGLGPKAPTAMASTSAEPSEAPGVSSEVSTSHAANQ
jgi:peptidoglycan hydrolase-like protein with peptidoglycan-binding domain